MKTTLDYVRELLQSEPRVLATIDVPALSYGQVWESIQHVAPHDMIVWVGPSIFHGLPSSACSVIVGALRYGWLSNARRATLGLNFYPVPPRQNYGVRVGPSSDASGTGAIHLMGWAIPFKDGDYDALFSPNAMS